MGTISSSIKLDDRMTPAIKSMLNGMNAMIEGFEDMETSSSKAIDTKSLKYARSEMAKASASFQQFEKSVSEAGNEQKKFNSTASASSSSISGLVSKVGALAASYMTLQGVGSVIEMADTYSQTTARLGLMNDGLQTTQELQDNILQSANESYSSYDSMADMVSKLGLMAGDAFSSTDEIVDFAEQISKQFVISGASASESSNAMLQLTQAMASGVLRGDELNSIFENAPTLIQSIADSLGVPIGEIRNMASEGEITADVIKKAMAKTANTTDERFEAMGKTFGQAWTVFQNKSGRAFQGVKEDLNALANSDGLDTFLNGLAGGVGAVGDILSGSGLEQGGMVGLFSGAVDVAKTNITDFVGTIGQYSDDMAIAFDGAADSWSNLVNGFNIEGSFGELLGEETVKFVKEIAWGLDDSAQTLGIIEDYMNLFNLDYTGYANYGEAWAARKSDLEADKAELEAFREEVQASRDQFKAQINTETFYKPLEEAHMPDTSAYTGFISQATTDIQAAVQTNLPTIQASGESMGTTLVEGQRKGLLEIPYESEITGNQTGSGFIQGLVNQMKGVETASGNMAQTAVDSANNTLDINSPSKVFQTMGQYVGDGLVLGLADRERDIKAGGDSAATALRDSFKDALGIHSPSTVFRDLGYYAMDGLIQGLSGTDMLSFSNGIVADIQSSFAAGNFNLQVGTEFLGDGAAEFFKSIGVGGATVEGLIKPVDGTVTSGFGWREPEMTASGEYSSSYHGGLDIGAAYGTPVGAAGAGEVDYAGWYGGYGKSVIIDHNNGLETLYGHLSSILTSVGQMVNAGDIIGLVGSTGNSTGPHLHFGIYQDGNAIDPSALYGYASGTMSARSGLYLTGENGPELINFGGGESVMNSKKTKNLFDYSRKGSKHSGGDIVSVTNTFTGDFVINSELDAKKVVGIIAHELNDSRIRRPS